MTDTHMRRPLRSDAAERRRTVLDAARRVFVQEGVDVPIERIANEAGVGRATVHRNFFDRKGLLLALLDEELDIFEADLLAQDLERNPMALFDAFAKLSLNNAALLPHWQSMNAHQEDFQKLRAKFAAIVEVALPRVVRSGQVRPDLSVEDVELVAGMLGAALKGENMEEKMKMTRRALEIIKSGLQR